MMAQYKQLTALKEIDRERTWLKTEKAVCMSCRNMCLSSIQFEWHNFLMWLKSINDTKCAKENNFLQERMGVESNVIRRNRPCERGRLQTERLKFDWLASVFEEITYAMQSVKRQLKYDYAIFGQLLPSPLMIMIFYIYSNLSEIVLSSNRSFSLTSSGYF